MDSKELRHLIRETTNQLSRVTSVRDKIKSAIGKYGSYAVQRLIEDYEYYTNRDGETFLSSLTVETLPDGVVHITNDMGYDLTWDDREKTWVGEGFAEDPSPLIDDDPEKLGWPEEFHPEFDMDVFDDNADLISKYPGAVTGLRKLLDRPGLRIAGEKIDAEGYLGMTDLFITDVDGKMTIGIQDSKNSYVWDPSTKEWV